MARAAGKIFNIHAIFMGKKTVVVFIAKKGRHEFSWGKTHGSNPYISLEGMSQTGFLSAE